MFTVYAERSARGWWVLEERTLGAVSQVRSLSEAADEMREAVAYLAGLQSDQVEIHVVPCLPDAFHKALDNAREARKEAEAANSRSALEYRHAARVLRDEGMSLRDIGTLLDVSYQRAGQLLKQA